MVKALNAKRCKLMVEKFVGLKGVSLKWFVLKEGLIFTILVQKLFLLLDKCR